MKTVFRHFGTMSVCERGVKSILRFSVGTNLVLAKYNRELYAHSVMISHCGSYGYLLRSRRGGVV